MQYIKKYKRGKSVIPDFNNMQSIYDDNGILRTDIDLGGKSWDQIINDATSRGYGSVSINGKNFTLYKKDKDGKIIKPWESKDWGEKNYDLSDASQVAAYNWIYRNDPSHTQLVYRSPIEPPKVEPYEEEHPYIPDPEQQPNTRPVFTETQSRNILGIPDQGRLSNFRPNLLLYTDPGYFNRKDVARNMNHYYGSNWNDQNYQTREGITLDPKKSLESTLGFVLDNNNLTYDRRGKTPDYLAMESARLDRTIGKYRSQGLTYRDLLNYYSKADENGNRLNFNGETIGGGQYTNYDDFIEALYKLGASYNGMQGRELKRLFGKDYDTIMQNIINNKNGQSSSLKNGGILRMLFI